MRNRKLGRLRKNTSYQGYQGCQGHKKAKALKRTARAAAKVPKSSAHLNKDYEA